MNDSAMNDNVMNGSTIGGSGASDGAILGLVDGALGGVRMRRPVDEIAARGRRLRTRRRSIAGAAAVGVLGVSLAVALPLSSASSQSVAAHGQPQSQPVNVDLAAWSVHTNADSTVTFTLREFWDPAKLEQVLAHAGVRALVTQDPGCGANMDVAGMPQIAKVMGFPVHKADGEVIYTVTPSAMPAGSVLDIHYYDAGTPHGVVSVSLLPHAPACK